MDEILVPPEVLADAHQRKDLRPATNTDSSRKLVSITVELPSVDEQVASNLVVLDPDVGYAKRNPLIDWAVRLVKVTKMPCCFCA